MNKKYLIELSSGLGNQIFQYALFLYLKQGGHNCILHAHKSMLMEHNGLELSKVFPSSSEFICNNLRLNSILYLYKKTTYLRSVLRHFTPWLYSIFAKLIPWRVIIFPSWKHYNFLDNLENKFYYFNFPELDNQNREIYDKMLNIQSVSIHVRRGDFQKYKKWRISLGDICTIDYYQKAIAKVYQCIKDPYFFVFSDDIIWVKQKLNLKNVTFIDWNRGRDAYKDLQLMTACKINICANSTFSLIGAWLNVNSDNIRIVPSKWHNQIPDILFNRYIPDNDKNWIVINNTRPQVTIILRVPVNNMVVDLLQKQTYTDYEVIMTKGGIAPIDSRFKIKDEPLGQYIYEIKEINELSDINYLRNKVMNEFFDSI